MKLTFLKFLKHTKAAQESGLEHVQARPYIVPLLGLLIGGILMLGIVLSRPADSLRPSAAHVVFLSDNGGRQTLDTKAKTVGDLIKKLPQLQLMPQDVVEPSLDTPIVQDNFRINIYRARPVTVIDQSSGQKIVTVTAQRSARVVAQAAGQTVYPEDNVSFAPGDVTQNILGQEVVIDPATPVQFTLYGTQVTVRTHAKTVAGLLKEKNITLTKDDTLTPAPNTPITAATVITLVRNGTQVTNVEQDIPAPVQYVDDPSLTLGATAVRQNGSPGKAEVTYQVVTQNGVITSKTQIQLTVITQPVPQIIARGTAVFVAGNKTAAMAAAGISAADYGYVDYIVSHESGWCPTKAQGEHYCPAVPDNQFTPYGYGLCQSTPGTKMETAGSDWATNPVTQLRWCSSYAVGSYGSWYGAYAHWVAYRWW